tara:strand:- start:1227 stop:2729 length:1503 start_codon:yes stop_codon:yes gene_type:complete
MLSVKRSVSPTAIEESVPMKRVKTNVSFLRHALSNNEKFDVDVTKSNGDWSVQIHHPATNYSYRLLTPPCPVKWSDLAPGGNKGRFDPPITISAAKLTVTLNMMQEDKWFAERKVFVDHLTAMNHTILEKVFEKHEPLRKSFMDRAKTLIKGKKKSDVEAMAKKLFIKAAKLPLREKDGQLILSAGCKAYKKDVNDEYVERDVTFYNYKKRQYECSDVPLTVSGGDYVGVVFQPSFYVLPGNASFGISYRLDNRSVVMYKRSVALQTCSNAVLNDNQRSYVFKFNKDKVYINDDKGRRYQMRTPPVRVKYCDLVDGTLGKFPGVTEANASLTASIEALPESHEWFKHFQNMANDCGSFLFEHPQCLKNVKAELLSTAKDMAEDMGQTVETAHKNMFLSSFKVPMKDNILRVSQRMFTKMGIRNTIPLFDKDGKVLENATVSRGATVQVCLEPTVYMLPNGTCGIKCNMDLKNGITVLDNPEEDQIENVGIYDISDSDEED